MTDRPRPCIKPPPRPRRGQSVPHSPRTARPRGSPPGWGCRCTPVVAPRPPPEALLIIFGWVTIRRTWPAWPSPSEGSAPAPRPPPRPPGGRCHPHRASPPSGSDPPPAKARPPLPGPPPDPLAGAAILSGPGPLLESAYDHHPAPLRQRLGHMLGLVAPDDDGEERRLLLPPTRQPAREHGSARLDRSVSAEVSTVSCAGLPLGGGWGGGGGRARHWGC